MKITVAPEGDEITPEMVFENVYQFSLCGSLQEQKMLDRDFRQSVIHKDGHNKLAGQLETTKLDVLDHKHGYSLNSSN